MEAKGENEKVTLAELLAYSKKDISLSNEQIDLFNSIVVDVFKRITDMAIRDKEFNEEFSERVSLLHSFWDTILERFQIEAKRKKWKN
jgi:hypothetical protein